MLSKKDVIEANKMFHTGKLSNEISLNFAISHVQRSRNWLRTAAVLSRAILIDHVFEDGNKRTAASIIAAIMELNNVGYSLERIDRAVLTIAKKNQTSITKIEKVISDARQ